MLLSLYVCEGVDVSPLFCDVVVALMACVCVWGGVRILVNCFKMLLLLSLYVYVEGDVSSLLCDVVVALYCMYVWKES